MNEMDWFDMGSPYDTRSASVRKFQSYLIDKDDIKNELFRTPLKVMHYSSNAFSVSPWWDTLRQFLNNYFFFANDNNLFIDFCSDRLNEMMIKLYRLFVKFNLKLKKSPKTQLVEGVFGNYEMMTSIDSSQLYTMYGCEIFGDFSNDRCRNGNILLPELGSEISVLFAILCNEKAQFTLRGTIFEQFRTLSRAPM